MADPADKNVAKPKVNRHNMSETQKTQQHLERLFKNIDKPVPIPDPPKEKTIKPPKDFVRNVPGICHSSSSGHLSNIVSFY